jgi:hypothetical protein
VTEPNQAPARSWRSRIWRWRWIILLTVLVVGVRLALPFVLRRVLVTQGAQILQSRIEVGNIDLWLLSGAIAIDDFALRPGPARTDAAPPASPPAGEGNPATATAAGDAAPLVAWKRLLVDIEWRPLLDKTVRVQEIVLDAPKFAVERLASGHFTYEPVVEAALAYAAASPTSAGTLPPATATPSVAAEQALAETTPTASNTGQPTIEGTATPTLAEATATATGGAGARATGWQVGLDRVAIRDGHVWFHDLMFKGSEPFDITIPTVDVKHIALSPGLYGDRSRAQVHIGLDEGSLDIDARLALIEKGFWLETNIEAARLPLRRSRLYIPNVGWSDLHGEVDASLWYGLESGVRDQLKGTVTLRNVSIAVPDLTRSALAWKSLKVRIDMLDLVGHVISIGEVDLSGADLTVELTGEERFPLLRKAMAGAPTEKSAAGEPEATSPSAEAGPQQPWQWSVSAVRVSDSTLHGITADAPLNIGVGLSVKNLAGSPGATASVDLAVTSDIGSVDVNGDARIAPPGFGGVIKLGNLTLPRIVALSGVLSPDLVRSATLQGELTVGAGMPPPASDLSVANSDVHVRGKLTLADPQVQLPGDQGAAVSVKNVDIGLTDLSVPGVLPVPEDTAANEPRPLSFQGTLALSDPLVALADGKEFSVGAEALDLGITEISVPGVLASPAGPAAQPIGIALSRLRLDTPAIRITRVPEGIVLPSFALAPEAAAPPPAEAPTPALPEPQPPPAEAAASAPAQVGIDTVQVTNGRLEITDRTVKPPFSGRLSPIVLQARDVHWPALAAKQFRLDLTTPTQGQILVTGHISPKGGTVDVDSREVALSPYNPYAAAFSPYRVAQGSLSLESKLTFADGRYDATNALTLHQLDIEGGGRESAFQKEFGLPVAMALALMRDTKGDIDLDIPVAINREGTQVDIVSIVGQAVRRAIVNALASPLKLFGAVMGGNQVSLAPPSISFKPGRAEPTDEGMTRIDQLGKLLENRPAMAVEIEAAATKQDERWLHEQALLGQWQHQGVLGALREIAQGKTRDRVQQALEARAKDETAELSPEDTAALDEWLKDVPAPSAQQLQALAAERLTAVATALHEQSGIDPARVRRAEPTAELVDGAPIVAIQLQSVAQGPGESEGPGAGEPDAAPRSSLQNRQGNSTSATSVPQTAPAQRRGPAAGG